MPPSRASTSSTLGAGAAAGAPAAAGAAAPAAAGAAKVIEKYEIELELLQKISTSCLPDVQKQNARSLTSTTGRRASEELVKATGLLDERSEKGGVVGRDLVAGSGNHSVQGLGGDVSARVAEDNGGQTGHKLVLIGTSHLVRESHFIKDKAESKS